MIQEKKQKLVWIILTLTGLLLINFWLGVTNANAVCAKYNYGVAGDQKLVTAAGRTWDFEITVDLHVENIEIKTYLTGRGVTFHVQIKINNEVKTDWDVEVDDIVTERYVNTKEVDFEIKKGDTLTFFIYGGEGTAAIGSIGGPNYIKMCEAGPLIAISPDNFKMDLEVLGSIPPPSPLPDGLPHGLTYDGVYLWVSDYQKRSIHQIDLNGNEISSFASPGSSPSGMAYDGTYLWVSDYSTDSIYKLSTSGSIITSFDAPGPGVSGLTFDGTFLWVADSLTRQIYKMTTSGAVKEDATFASPARWPLDLAFDGEFLWNADGVEQKIYQINTDGEVMASYDAPGKAPDGLTFAGNFLWNVSYEEKIYQLDVSARVKMGTTKTRIFTITNEGNRGLETNNFKISGPDQSEFVIENNNCEQEILEPEKECTFEIVFTPDSTGTKQANLEIKTNVLTVLTLDMPLNAVVTQASTTNQSPTAKAGKDRTVAGGSTVTLDGSSSYDLDDGIADYQWVQTSGSPVTLLNEDTATAEFKAPTVGTNDSFLNLTFALTVSDEQDQRTSDTVTITISEGVNDGKTAEDDLAGSSAKRHSGGECFITGLIFDGQ